MIETISLFGHIICFVVTIVPLWVMCPKNSAKDVFTIFVDSGGWENIGTVLPRLAGVRPILQSG